MYGCTQEAKIHAYKALIRPHLEYACAICAPFAACDIALLESVQNRAARWINSIWDPIAQRWSKSSAVCVKDLKWPSLKVRRDYFSFWTLYSILHKATAIDFSSYFHFNNLPTRSHHLTLSLVSSSINAFRHSFLWLLLCYGTQFHLTFCHNQRHPFLNKNLIIFFFILKFSYLFCVFFCFVAYCFVCMSVCT